MKRAVNILQYMTGGLVNILVSAAVLILIYLAATRAYEYGKGLLVDNAVSRPSRAVSVAIEDGKDTAAVAQSLYDAGLIANKYIFNLQARLNGSYKFFKTGTFDLNQNMSGGEIMVALQSNAAQAAEDEGHIRLVEGLSNKQMAALAESEGLFPAEDFLAACAEFDLSYYGFLDGAGSLEGFLFPDTYNLPADPQPDDLIFRQLNRFNTLFTAEMEARAEELGLSVSDVVTIASIIEKEIKRPEERALCASVIYNRLDIGMPLQMCSTVLYALDKRKVSLTEEDLLVKSPYNTYQINGLPKGAICNPGLAAIEAALYPADTDYIFFVVKDEETGEHVFTASNDEFLAAKAKYNQRF